MRFLGKKAVRWLRPVSILVMVCVLAAAVSPSVFADDLSDLQNRYNQLQKEQKQVQGQIQDNTAKQKSAQAQKTVVDKNVSLVTQQISVLNTQISALNVQIAQKQQEAADKQKKIDEDYVLFKQRIRAQYEAGSASYIEILLSSGNITDFLNRMETLRVVSAHDNKLLTQLRQEKTDIEAAQKAVESDKVSLQTSKSNLTSKQNELNAQQSQQQALILQLQNQQKGLQNQNNQLEGDMKQANNDIQQYIAQHASKSSSNVVVGDGFFLWPVRQGQYSIGVGFGGYPGHTGQDIRCPIGTPVYAAAAGTVILAAHQNYSYGNHLLIDHGNGVLTLYAHNSELLVGLGQHVEKGQQIAVSGNTGNTTGPHLHFEVRLNNGSSMGEPVNPMKYTYSYLQ